MMKTTPTNENTALDGGEFGKATKQRRQSSKKIDRVIAALFLPHGLNRFEAERIGDHCLNSTVANIREMMGDQLIQQWETVPTRYCETGVRVLRYWLIGRVS